MWIHSDNPIMKIKSRLRLIVVPVILFVIGLVPHSVYCYAGVRMSNRHLNNFQLISGKRNSFEHLYLVDRKLLKRSFHSCGEFHLNS